MNRPGFYLFAGLIGSCCDRSYRGWHLFFQRTSSAFQPINPLIRSDELSRRYERFDWRARRVCSLEDYALTFESDVPISCDYTIGFDISVHTGRTARSIFVRRTCLWKKCLFSFLFFFIFARKRVISFDFRSLTLRRITFFIYLRVPIRNHSQLLLARLLYHLSYHLYHFLKLLLVGIILFSY